MRIVRKWKEQATRVHTSEKGRKEVARAVRGERGRRKGVQFESPRATRTSLRKEKRGAESIEIRGDKTASVE